MDIKDSLVKEVTVFKVLRPILKHMHVHASAESAMISHDEGSQTKKQKHGDAGVAITLR